MNYAPDFDPVLDRRGTNSPKWDAPNGFGVSDVISLSVADMDFRAPAPIRAAVQERAALGIFGYTDLAADHGEVVQRFLAEEHMWEVGADDVIYCRGVARSVALMLRAWTTTGAAVLIHAPYYTPLAETILRNGRQLIAQPLILENGRYHMDFEAMADAFGAGVQAMVLVNPHNPTGRVWTRAELTRLAELCLDHNVLLISDDVHADFTQPGHDHLFAAGLAKEISQNTVTFTSLGKTFNVPGLEISHLIITDPTRREQFRQAMRAASIHNPSFFASAVTRAAYRDSLGWLVELRAYLAGNLALLRRRLASEMPRLKLVEPEGTYLGWIDARHWGSATELANLMTRARINVGVGASFGPVYEQFFRLNYATPQSQLIEALDRLHDAYRTAPTP
ncbi:MAG: MalY/PatB family protein [Georgenia sp.]